MGNKQFLLLEFREKKSKKYILPMRIRLKYKFHKMTSGGLPLKFLETGYVKKVHF